MHSMTESRWQPLTLGKLIAFVIGLALLCAAIFLSQSGFVFLLDHANLLFHEAGHVLLGFFSDRLEPYGGTVGQLIFPSAVFISAWRQRQTLGVGAASLWFFENWLNIAYYMADARKLQLPLVGGGNHDWNTMFDRWGLLQYDTAIASVVNTAAWLGFVLTCVWVVWRTWRDYPRPLPRSSDPAHA